MLYIQYNLCIYTYNIIYNIRVAYVELIYRRMEYTACNLITDEKI